MATCAIAFNVVQPTMEMGLHCTVHDYLVVSLGGACDVTNKTFITFFEFIITGVVAAVAGMFVYFTTTALAENLFWGRWRRIKIYSNLFYLPLFEFYSSGAAASRRFV